jgi:aryl-alcohol dehydrogenase-like predicted oxidoreductase
MMLYGQVPGLDKPVSRLIQGTTVLTSEDVTGSYRLLDGFFEMGCTTFDSAHIYGGGDCERILGGWMAERGVRDKVVVITKGAHFNADRNRVTPFDITSDLHDSLARLQTDYIDLYLLHRDDLTVDVAPIVEVLNEHYRAGRIRAFGGSNWCSERIIEANTYADAHGLTGFSVSSPQFSLVEMVEPPWPGCVSLGGDAAASARHWYCSEGVPVFAWSSLARGFLSGTMTRRDIEAADPDTAPDMVRCFRSKENLDRLDRAVEMAERKSATVPQIGLAYLLHQQIVVYPVVGSETEAEFQENVAATEISLTPDELAWLETGAPIR